MKKYINEIAFRVIYGITYIFSLLPFTVLYAFSSVIYCFTFYIFSYRKMVVIQNLSRSFPEKRYGEIKAITKKFYISFANHFTEIIKSISISSERLQKRVEFVHFDIVTDFLAQGKNVIAAVGHCGNWEVFNILTQSIPMNAYSVYKPLRNPVLDKLMYTLRSRFGMKLIASKKVARHILSPHNEPGVYLFLADQCPRIVDEKYRLTFLNQSTAMFPGVEKLGKTSNAVVVYFNVLQTSKGIYRIECKLITENPKQTADVEITQKYAHLLEENIKEDPSGWLWTHKRWKR